MKENKWYKIADGLPTKSGTYAICHSVGKTEKDKMLAKEAAVFSTENNSFMSTFMMQTISGEQLILTYKEITHWMFLGDPKQ